LLRVEGLAHRFPDGRLALDDVSFAISPGEVVALIGRNGSGKTTLARHLNGLLRPTAGRVLLGGREVAGLPLERVAQRVGYVFQDPDHQLFAPSVEEEVAFGPRNLDLPEAEVTQRVAAALAAVELDEPGARASDPFLLDKGTRQRLAVAAVLALHPDVVVLDEPTTGLDWPQQRRMMALVRSLQRAGRAVVVITHTPWVIAEYAERVLLLAAGRLHYDGPVRRFFADPALVAAASFEAPDATRLGQALGCTPLSVDELLAWMPERPPA
jgi:energy-coupling factor transport system ATP-binding protein